MTWFLFRALTAVEDRARMGIYTSLKNMMTSSNWKHFRRYWPFVWGVHRSPVNSPHKGQWCGALMFSLTCTRINGWVNNGEAGDLRRHRARYDVTVMKNWLRKFTHALFLCVSWRRPSFWEGKGNGMRLWNTNHIWPKLNANLSYLILSISIQSKYTLNIPGIFDR